MAYSKKQKKMFLEILRSKNFNVSKACKDFNNLSRVTYNSWLQEDWFKQAVDDMLEEEIDESEEVHRILRKGIPKVENKRLVGWEQKPDRRAIEFFLQTKAKDRGYVKRIEQTGKDGKPLVPNKFKVVIKKKVD
jgi:hypothetical protein